MTASSSDVLSITPSQLAVAVRCRAKLASAVGNAWLMQSLGVDRATAVPWSSSGHTQTIPIPTNTVSKAMASRSLVGISASFLQWPARSEKQGASGSECSIVAPVA